MQLAEDQRALKARLAEDRRALAEEGRRAQAAQLRCLATQVQEARISSILATSGSGGGDAVDSSSSLSAAALASGVPHERGFACRFGAGAAAAPDDAAAVGRFIGNGGAATPFARMGLSSRKVKSSKSPSE